MRRFAGRLLGLIVRAWVATLRLRWALPPGLEWADAATWVIAFCHGQQMVLMRGRDLRARARAVLVSTSRDGDLQTGAMTALGFIVERGSSSRRGAGGLRAVVSRLEAGMDAAFAIDGPRGPAGTSKPGAALAARLASARLVPVASAAAHCLRLGSWDRFEIPVPFTRVAVVAAAPLDPELVAATPSVLDAALAHARRDAEVLLRPCPEGVPGAA